MNDLQFLEQIIMGLIGIVMFGIVWGYFRWVEHKDGKE